jgi:tRNA threonylcarbamoyladenosine biosynthesis protein TsaB
VISGLWLAIETTTDIASVAVGSAQLVAAARGVAGARQHAAQVVPLIDQVLQLAALRIDQLAGVVVGDGPGSFTGLRIGWAAGKAIAQEREIPLVAVPSLLAAAYAAAAGEGGPVAVCFDALRGQVFGAVYAFADNRVETLVAPAVLTVTELAAATPVRPRLAAGDGAERYADAVRSWTARAPFPLSALPPVAGSLLALLDWEGASRPLGDTASEPVYGRPAEAQVKWEARYGRPLPDSSR